MFFTQADNLGDALRIQAEPTLAANVVIPKMATVEEYDAQGVAMTIEQLGGEEWARHYFPYLFGRPNTSYQGEFWDWGWKVEPDEYYRPWVECDPRGVGKSTHTEVLCASLIARRKRSMIGYVSFE